MLPTIFVLVLFWCLRVWVYRLLGGGIVHLCHTSWVQASTDNVVYLALYACISTAVSWCIPAWKCPTFSRHNSIRVWFHNIGYWSNLLWVCIFLSSIWWNDLHVPFQHILYLWVCLTVCKASSHANAKRMGINSEGWVGNQVFRWLELRKRVKEWDLWKRSPENLLGNLKP